MPLVAVQAPSSVRPLFGMRLLTVFPFTVDKYNSWCHIVTVTLLGLRLRPGQSIFDQLVFAAKKAFVSGEFAPGQTFPSVRTLAADLKIHPNTAHKVIQYLIQEGWLVSKPGVGTVVGERRALCSKERSTILQQQAEQIVVEAKRLGLEFDAVMQAVELEWLKLESPLEVRRK